MLKHGLYLRIPGRPPAKSNSYRAIQGKNFAHMVKSAEVTAYEELIATISKQSLLQLPPPEVFIPKPQAVELIAVWHRADYRRKDLENIGKAITDGLTKGRMWSDDVQVITLLLKAEFDALEVATEWVDLYIRPLPLMLVAPKKKRSCTCAVAAAPSASVPAITPTKSGMTPASSAGSAASAGNNTRRKERIAQ